MIQFVTRLQKLAATCEFGNVAKEIKSAVIQNCLSKRLRQYALREDALTLDNLMAKACSLEASEMEASGMEKKLPTEEANLISQKQQPKADRQLRKPTPSNTKTCRQCGLTWAHNAKPCPAKGQVCHKCGKQNHFAKMCLTQVPTQQHSYRPQQRQQPRVNQVTSEPVDPESSSDDEYLYVLSQDAHGSRIPTMSVMINEIPVDMIIDTGASIDILDETAYRKVNYSGKSLSNHQQSDCLHMDQNYSYMLLVVLKLLSLAGTIAQLLHYMY